MWSVFFVFLSYLDRNFVKGEFLSYSLNAEKEGKELFYMLNNTLCAKSSIVGEYHLHQVTDGVVEVRSVHDSEGHLVDCSVTQNEMQVKSFMHVCRLGLRDQKMNNDLKLSLTGVSEAKANCDKLKSKGDRNVVVKTKQPKESRAKRDAADNKKKLRRSKRGFTYPGTLWCGAGNIADHYDQLGEFAETDKCCRVHDHCPYVIHAFSNNYGYTNFKWHSLSHCDCDNALKECLRRVNDTSSRVVGQAFFNVIEVPCFEFSFEEQCVERHWYGVCKKYDKVPVAVIKESNPYDFGGIEVIDVLTLAPPNGKQPSSDKEKQDETQSTESTTQSTFSESKSTTPEEPSLTNVVTAAEDFIKVLATVSTSQSSSTDTGKGETQTSEKKRKKNSGKKKKENKKKRGKGKGRKKNKHLATVLKVDEGTAGAPSTSQTEEVMSKNKFVDDPVMMNQFSKKENNFMNSELDAVGKGALSNKMMKDEPQRVANDNQDVDATSKNTEKEPEILEYTQVNNTELASLTPTIHPTPAIHDKTRSPKLRRKGGKKKQRNNHLSTEVTQRYLKGKTLSPSPTEGVRLTSTTESPINAERKEALHSTEYNDEKGPVVSTSTTQNTPIVRTKRPRLRQREGRKRMRKLTPATEEPPHKLTPEVPLTFTGSEAQVTVGVNHEQERLGLERLENPTESFVTSDGPAETQRKNGQSLKDTKGRRKSKLRHSNLSKAGAVNRICHVSCVTTDADTTALPILLEKKNLRVLQSDSDPSEDPKVNTAPTFPSVQTNTPSLVVTRRPRTTKMKRTKERGDRGIRRKVKKE